MPITCSGTIWPGVVRTSYEKGRAADTTHMFDFVDSYVADLNAVVDMAAVRHAGLRIGVDPLGGASVALWRPIAEHYGLEIDVANEVVDPTFGFMPLDHDGRIRMDCSSPYAMANLISLKDRFDIAIGNDPDADRHGIVTPGGGLMNPNHYLAAAISYLFSHRPQWSADAAVGKTVVTSSIVDRVAARIGRRVVEVPVGFKWFVPGLLDGSLGFGGEESAGASFLRQDGTPWSTDKDGIAMGLLACELMARTGRSPSELYRRADAGGRSPDLRAHRYARQPGRQRSAVESLAVRRQRVRTGRRSDSSRSDGGARQWRAHRRTESRGLARLVCRTSVGYGGGLQALRRKLPRHRSPAAHPGRGRSDRERHVDGNGAMKVDTLVETAPSPECDATRASAQQVFLVRHGDTDSSLSGQHTGVSGIPLTEHARHTARRLGLVLARERFALVLTSPLGCARATCTLAGLGDLAETDPDLREWDYGEYKG